LQDKVINQVIIMTMMMLIGTFLRKKKIATDEVLKGFSELLITVTLPCAILVSFNISFSKDMLNVALSVFLASVGIHAFVIFFSHIFYIKSKESKKAVLRYLTAFPNCGFIGIPLMQGIFGPIGVFYASIFIVPNTIFTFSYGTIIFSGVTTLKSIIRNLFNVPFIFTMIGAALFLTSTSLPGPVLEMAKIVGDMTAPLAMFIVGAMLADTNLLDMVKGGEIYVVGFFKLILFPIVTYLALRAVDMDQTATLACVLLTAMPSGAMGAIFSQRFGGDNALASKGIFLTTILSMITIPAIVWVIQ